MRFLRAIKAFIAQHLDDEWWEEWMRQHEEGKGR